jgi:predicted GIY-YIG superfamily endonuclease
VSSHVVYHAHDGRGRLLYVGMTGDLPGRLAQHAEHADWWGELTDLRLERFPDRASAAEAELRAIAAARPWHNRKGAGSVYPRGDRWVAQVELPRVNGRRRYRRAIRATRLQALAALPELHETRAREAS